jgi:hypothetical protein
VDHAFRRTRAGYQVTFGEAYQGDIDEPYLIVDVEQVERIAWGLMATLTFRADSRSAFPGHVLFVERLNLVKMGDRLSTGRRMAELLAEDRPSVAHHDWPRYLERIAILVTEAMSEAPPLVNPALIPFPPPQRHLVVGLLVRNKPNILYGAGGTGKSMLALRVAASVLSGERVFGCDVMDRGTTLYLDWEDDQDTITERNRMVAAGMGMPDRFPMDYQCFRGLGAYERHHGHVMDHLEAHPEVRLVIFDSTAMAMQGMVGDMAETAIRFYSLINEIPATVLLIDHIASDDVKAGGAAKPYGSVFKVNAARNVWEVAPEGNGLLMRHRKTNVGRRQDDIALALTWSLDRVEYRRVGSYVPLVDDVPDEERGYAPDD